MFIRVVQSFNIIVRPRPFFKWPNLKCHVRHINQFDQFLDWTLRVLDIRLQYWERWFFSKWHRRLGRKVIQILPTGDEPMTFCLLVKMLYHWATGTPTYKIDIDFFFFARSVVYCHSCSSFTYIKNGNAHIRHKIHFFCILNVNIYRRMLR